jgi:hypothetical protein
MENNKHINMLMGYCSFIGYELSEMLLQNKVIDKCVLAGWKKEFARDNDNIEYIYLTDQWFADYSKYVDINTLPALSKSLLEQMLPYESMCIELARRGNNYPITEYETEKMKYHTHLRFWNWILESREIDIVYFDEVPHNMMSDYVIYALAEIKKIPILMAALPCFLGIRVYGRNINDIGYEIEDYYLANKDKISIEEGQLTGIIGDYYRTKRKNIENSKEEFIDSNYIKLMRQKQINFYFERYLGWRKFCKYYVYRIKALGKGASLSEKEYIENYPKVHRFLRHKATKIKKFDNEAQVPDYNKKYIAFLLQMTPEGSTMPIAGVFTEQYTSIQMIARAAEKNGLYVYVKEHFVQPFRESKFYELIAAIPNVVLIKSTVNSYKLIRNSVAVATQTGSCILESAIIGKPALVVGNGYAWRGLPNVSEIVNENQGAEIIKKIIDGKYIIDQQEIIKYFYSVNQVCIDNPIPEEGWQMSYGEYMKESEEKRVKKIKDYISRYVLK